MSEPTPRRGRSLAALVGAAAIVASLAACGSPAPEKSPGAAADIPVGFQTAMSGNNATSGVATANAFQAYIDKVNSEGGIEGHKIVVSFGDDQTNPANAPGVAKSLVEDDKVVLLAGTATGATAAIAPYLQQRKVLVISTSGSDTLLTNPDWTVRNFLTNYSAQGATIAKYGVEELGFKKFAIVYTPDALGQPWLDGAKAELKEDGIEPVAEIQYTTGETNFDAQAAQIKDSGADMVLINGLGPVVFAPLVKSVDRLGASPAWGMSTAAVTNDLIDALGDELDGRAFLVTPNVLVDSDDAADFRKWVKEAGGDATNQISFNGWGAAEAAVAVLTRAVKAAGGDVPTSAEVVAAADGASVDSPTLRGLKWTKTVHGGAQTVQVLELTGGGYKNVQAFGPVPKANLK